MIVHFRGPADDRHLKHDLIPTILTDILIPTSLYSEGGDITYPTVLVYSDTNDSHQHEILSRAGRQIHMRVL